ncbi:hypothetical protein HU200_012641 [Digitaria exilis]|uniref:Uncharacterized protein n=1 Tax=Digitaria exilis TaxID=1010633 RepID=A0A834ZYV7_9POAL|nr:hypothetical protein HU200_065321 [Digitaria exilis]KAF8749623.1 hypothetical protein HU200_012641 [Digitaria exilis]CAB3483879.1 unnamed protein product [Digitaria exilis]CAB3486390.1 unnamed protein product [Digitaria exilis]
MPTLRRRNPEVPVKALEGIVSANTFFTVAVFIGITGTITPSTTIHPACVAGDDIARNFFLFEILSFGFYLLSSLVAQGMKLAVTLLAADDFFNDGEQKPPPSDDCEEMPAWRAAAPRERRRAVLRFAQPMMLLAAACSIMGTFFLLLSMVDAIQLKFGIVSCGTPLAVGATLALSALVVGGLLFYGCTVAYALTHYLP